MRRSICSGVLAVCCVVFPVSKGLAQHCESYWTAAYKCMEHCGPCPTTNNRNSNYSNYDYGAAQRAQAAAAAAAAEAQRQRDAELEQQRIAAENQRRMEEIANQAKFNQDKQQALGQLKGIANGDDFDSASGLKGVGSTDSGLKDSLGSGALKTGNTDPMVVDARNVPTGLPKSVAAEIPATPAGDRVRKGFEAIQDHDWKVALAWFQDALNHDPGNAGIQRLIDLAHYTMARANRPHPSALPAKPAANLSAQDKSAMAATDEQMDNRMNADLAKSLEDFKRNYLPKHPQLLMPTKPPAPAPAAQPSPVASAPELDNEPIKPNWNVFFDALFGSAKLSRVPGAVSAVRD